MGEFYAPDPGDGYKNFTPSKGKRLNNRTKKPAGDESLAGLFSSIENRDATTQSG